MFLGTEQKRKTDIGIVGKTVKPARNPIKVVEKHTCAFLVTATCPSPPNAPHCQLQSSHASEDWSERNATNAFEIMNETNFIQGKAAASLSEKLSTPGVGDKMKNLEKRLTYLVNQKVGEAIKTTCENVEKTNAVVVAVGKSMETCNNNASQKVNNGKTNRNIS